MGNRALQPEASVVTPAPRPDCPMPARHDHAHDMERRLRRSGAEGDAISDGGKRMFPESGEFVQKNLDGIVATLKSDR